MDVLNRLTGVSYPNSDTASYTYDAAGNRLTSRLNATTTNYTYDSAGRLTSAAANALTYDAASNVTTNGSSSFSWDWAGRLASATVGGATSTYTYDGDGTRVAAASSGATTNYVWDRAASLPLLIDDGSQGYVQTDQGLLEQLGSTASYPLSDALGSVRSLASSTASVLGTTSYDAFGSVRLQTGLSTIFGFTGQQTDSTGLSYLRARYYDPNTGTFLAPDSVQPNAAGTQGFDLYTYVANNPASLSDPSGSGLLDLAISFIREHSSAAVLAAGGAAIAVVLFRTVQAMVCVVEVAPCPPGISTDGVPRPPSDSGPVPNPIPTILKVAAVVAVAACNIFCRKNDKRIYFGQRRISDQFGDSRYPDTFNKSIYEVARDLKQGSTSPATITVTIFWDSASSKWVAENNRSLAALAIAHLRPVTTVVDAAPGTDILSRLTEAPLISGGQLPSTRTAVTPSQRDLTILDVIDLDKGSLTYGP